MLARREDFYKGNNEDRPIDNDRYVYERLLDVRLMDIFQREVGLGEGVFSDNVVQALRDLERKSPVMFGIGRTERIPGLDDRVWRFSMDLGVTSGEEYETEMGVKPVSVGTSGEGRFTDTLVILPGSGRANRVFDLLKQDGDGIVSERGRYLQEAARRYDTKKYSTITGVFDPEDLVELREIDHVLHDIRRNAREIQRYFSHMASLVLNGTFANLTESKTITGVRGLLPDNEIALVGALSHPEQLYGIDRGNGTEVNREGNATLKKFLGRDDPWYRQAGFERPLNLEKMLGAFSELGGAFNMGAQGEQPSSAISSIATEYFLTELYEAITGKVCNGQSFNDKLKKINATEPFEGLLDPYIAVYNGGELITPGKARAVGVHTGNSDAFKSDAVYIDSWATLFYQDVVKTLVSAMMDEPRQFFDFDMYARNSNLVREDNTGVAYVPLSVSKLYE